MRFYTIALLTGATAVAATKSATLLLPGFAGQDLQASVVETNGDATTYKVTCPKTADVCGIVGDGMTAIAAPTSVQLMNIDLQGTVGTVSCNVAGTTYASCHASAGTATPSGTLGPDDLNWMPVAISTTHTPTSTTTTTTKAPTSTTTTTEVTSTSTPTMTSAPTPKKSSSALVSSTASVSSSTRLVAAPSNGTGAPAASSTPFNAAGQLAGSIWTVGGAFAALACAFA